MTEPLKGEELAKASELADCLIKLRNKLDAFEEKYKKEIAQTLENFKRVEAKATAFLEDTGIESARTEKGTIHFYTKKYASLSDADKFLDYVIRTGEVDLMERRASSQACYDYAEEHGKLPPGVKLEVVRKLGIRKPNT